MLKKIGINPREAILEIIGDDQEVIFYDGLDNAIIGTAERPNLGPVVAYDSEKCIEVLTNSMEVTEEDLEEGETIEGKKTELAIEWFDYNVISGYVGELTPIFITKINTND